MPPRYANISATDDPIHFMFGSSVGFSGTADLMALFPVRTNPRWRPQPSWKNFKWPYLRNQSYRFTSPQRLTIYLYSAHRAVIFAIAQLSCSSSNYSSDPHQKYRCIPTVGTVFPYLYALLTVSLVLGRSSRLICA